MSYLRDAVERAVERAMADWAAHGGTLHGLIMSEIDDSLLCLGVDLGDLTLDELTAKHEGRA